MINSRRRSKPVSETYRLADRADRIISVLGNGLTVIAQHHGAAPVVAVRVFVQGGTVQEGPWSGSGISHLFEHLLTGGGTKTLSERDLARWGDSIGGITNAYTSSDHICYHATTARRHMAETVALLGDWVSHPGLLKEVFEREVGVVLRELERDRDDPDVQLEELLHEVLYAGHPNRHPVIGLRERLTELRHEDLVSYYEQTHAADNVIVVVVGDVSPRDALDRVRRAFADLKRRGTARPALPELIPHRAAARAIREMEVESATMTIAWLTVRQGHPDEAALDVLGSVLTEGDGARLVRRLRWDQELVYGIGGGHSTTWHTPGMFQISLSCDESKLATVERAIAEEIERLRAHPVDETELARAVRQEVVATQAQRQTAEGLASMMGEDYLATGNPDFSDALITAVQRTTIEDVHRVAGTYLRPEWPVTAAIVPLVRRRSTARVRSRQKPTSPRVWRLPNGLTCVWAATAGSEFAGMYAGFPGGLRAETSANNGAFNLLAETMLRGSRSRSGQEIAAAFAGKGSAIRSGAGADGMGFEFTSLLEDFEGLSGLFAEVIIDPALEERELRKIKPSLLDAIARIDEDWQSELARVVREQYFRYSPYRRVSLGTEATIRRMGARILTTLHRAFVVGGGGVVVVATDGDYIDVKRALKEHFARLPAGRVRSRLPRVRPEPVQGGPRLFVKESAADRQVAALFVGFPGNAATDRRMRAPATLLGTMLVGYSLSGGRLFEALRGGDRDLVYQVGASGFAGLLPGYSGVSAACEPGRVSEVFQVIRDQIELLRSGQFDAEELKRAKAMVVMGELEQSQTPMDRARRIGADILLGLGADDQGRFLREIRGVSRSAILAAARKMWPHPTIVVVTPQPDSVDFGLRATRVRT